MKPRNFVLVINKTTGITTGELERALQRVASGIHNGRASIESGNVRDDAGKVIGQYSWQTPPPVPDDQPQWGSLPEGA